MEQNTINHNSSFAFGKVVLTTWATASIAIIAITVGVSSCEYQTAQSATTFTPNVQPSYYGIMALRITSDTTGEAVINLDNFRVPVSFVFDKHKDSYGVAGSEFTAVEITDLEVGQITDLNGNKYRDFTNFDDHRNINAQLAAYIEKNKLVEAVS